MPEITIKATITPDHKLHADVPDDFPVGEAEVVLKYVKTRSGQRDRIVAAMKRAADQRKGPEPTKEEIDREIQAERDSWD